MSRTKGCTQIKSLASLKKSGSQSGDRHVRHFQVASLEIERARRLKERQDAVDRLEANNRRLDEIDGLLRGHYQALGLVFFEEGEGEDTMRAESTPPRAGYVRPAAAAPAAPEPSGAPLKRVVLYGR